MIDFQDYEQLDLVERAYRVFAKYPALNTRLREVYDQKEKELCTSGACYWLLDFDRDYLRLPVTPLNVESSDKEIKASAEAMASKCERFVLAFVAEQKANGADFSESAQAAIELLKKHTTWAGVNNPLPEKKEYTGDDFVSALARLQCPKWWRRQLRVVQARQLETAARKLGMVCKKYGGYCSMVTLKRRAGQKRRNRELLEKLIAESDQGDVYTLAELADAGVSNPVNRRAELMTRISGFEQLADHDPDADWQPVFYTLTCPSKFHSHHRGGGQYSNWDDSTPRDAQAHLCWVWSLVRAEWDKVGIRVFGFRVAEPHHDGCPHWHLLLWIQAGQVKQASEIFRVHALAVDGQENGADKRRLKVDLIEKGEGKSATGYIAKYISKNVDGLTEEGEAWSSDSVKTAMRTEAWASTWGIRQFQQIGGASVTVWRELRRLRAEDSTLNIEAIRKAADAGDWMAFTKLMGGAVVRRAEQPLRALYLAAKDKINDYGEQIKKIWGLMANSGLCREIQTRLREWVVTPLSRIPDFAPEAQSRGASPPALDLCQ